MRKEELARSIAAALMTSAATARPKRRLGRYSFETLIADALARWTQSGVARSEFLGFDGRPNARGLAQRHRIAFARAVVCDFGCASTAHPRRTAQGKRANR